MRLHIIFFSALGMTAAGLAIAADTKLKPSLPSQPGVVTTQPVKPGVTDDKSGFTVFPFDLTVSLPNPMNGTVVVANIGLGPTSSQSLLYLTCRRVGYTSRTNANAGCAPAPAGLSPPFNWGDEFSTPIRLPRLQPGGRYVHTLPFWSTLRWESGSYEFRAVVQQLGLDKPERVTANNTASSTLTVPQWNQPDLVPVLNNPMDGTLIVRNDGLAAAPPTRLRLRCVRTSGQDNQSRMCATFIPIPPRYARDYYWDSRPQYGDYMYMNIPALAPGATWRLPQAFWSSLRWASGTYSFQATADFDGVVTETSEGNNPSNYSTMVIP